MKEEKKLAKVAEDSDIDKFFLGKLMEHELPIDNINLITTLEESLTKFKDSFGPNMTKGAIARFKKIKGWLLHMYYLLDD